MAKILGLDLGTNSIGWAVVENTDNKFELKEKGVHIFQEGVKIEKGIESSKAAERTNSRSTRKGYYRRRLRKIETLKVLIDNGLCPTLTNDELYNWRYKKIYPANNNFRKWLQTSEEENKNPYFYRSKASTSKFDLNNEHDRYMLGRAFYHIVQRRGFLSNRLDQGSDDVIELYKPEIQQIAEDANNITELILTFKNYFENFENDDKQLKSLINKIKRVINYLAKAKNQTFSIDEERKKIINILNKKENLGKVKRSIKELDEKIASENCNTLGEYFYKVYERGGKIRNQHTARKDHYLKEFKTICKCQNISSKLENDLEKAIFYQRPLKSQKSLVGKCPFEPTKSRCPISHPLFEEYRMLCFINNIKIKTPDDEKLRFLTIVEKEKINPKFFRKSKENFDFEDIAKELAPKKQYKYYKSKGITALDYLFNYKLNTTVSGCPTSAKLLDIFGDNWQNIKFEYIRDNDGKKSFIDINDIWHVLFSFDSNDKIKEFAIKRLNFDSTNAEKLARIRLKKDYANLSLKAIKKILPFLRKGLIYSHAVFMANIEQIIPSEIWKEESNRNLINNSIEGIINNQNEEKSIIEIVNGTIKVCRDNEYSIGENTIQKEALLKELMQKIENYYGKNKWTSFNEDLRSEILLKASTMFERQMIKNLGRGEFLQVKRIDERVKEFLADNFNVSNEKLKKLYHPSAIEIYKPAKKDPNDNKYYLGSPRISSVRNPMAMRALFQLRRLVNKLIKNDLIDKDTKINIELSRELNDANKRKAIQSWQRIREDARQDYRKEIIKLYKAEGGNEEPTEDEILKYQLWIEQERTCVYTGKPINVSDFIGADPKFDIEHTIPKSLSYDNSQENKTLCCSIFNRQTKRNKIPLELQNHNEILVRIEAWKEKFENLEKQIEQTKRQSKAAATKEAKDSILQKRHRLTLEKDYWKNKYDRFVMKDVPEGFKNSQLVDIGIITKYSRLYLRTVFESIYTVKGSAVAEFRKIWGIQNEYEKKERVNHIHHCIDAITIACMTKNKYEFLATYYKAEEKTDKYEMERVIKEFLPWKNFVVDLKQIQNEVLVSHYTPDVLPKQSKKKLRKKGEIIKNNDGLPIYQQGDTTRASLHKDTFYGAIKVKEENKNNEEIETIKYVTRKPVDSLSEGDINNIVDKRIKSIIINAKTKEKGIKKEIESLKKDIDKLEAPYDEELKAQVQMLERELTELYSLPNEKGPKVPIKKVRIFTPDVSNPIHLKKQQHKSPKKDKLYKESYYVKNDGNYVMGIYEGVDNKGKITRTYEIVNNLEAGSFYKFSNRKDNDNPLLPLSKEKGKNRLELRATLKTGDLVLLYNKYPDEIWDLDTEDRVKRLYKISQFESDGRVQLRFHQVAKPDKDLKKSSKIDFKTPEEKLRLSLSGFNALIQNIDFKIDILGNISK
jgi:CRISPR-associated endonuclease Csn1